MLRPPKPWSSVTATPIHNRGIAAVMGAGLSRQDLYPSRGIERQVPTRETPPHRAKGHTPYVIPSLALEVADVVESPQPTEIAPGVIVTGAIPRRNTYEDIPDPFFLDENCTQPDPLIDDKRCDRNPPGLGR